MSTESITVSATIPAAPAEIYAAFLDSAAHTAMTGGKATTSAELGAPFTCWGGYITGRNLTLEPGRRIVQSWRTSQFPDGAADSQIELRLEAVAGGTLLTIAHSNIPVGQGHQYQGGWQERYFAPMTKYFAARAGA